MVAPANINEIRDAFRNNTDNPYLKIVEDLFRVLDDNGNNDDLTAQELAGIQDNGFVMMSCIHDFRNAVTELLPSQEFVRSSVISLFKCVYQNVDERKIANWVSDNKKPYAYIQKKNLIKWVGSFATQLKVNCDEFGTDQRRANHSCDATAKKMAFDMLINQIERQLDGAYKVYALRGRNSFSVHLDDGRFSVIYVSASEAVAKKLPAGSSDATKAVSCNTP